jgi:hypothetical protein
LAIGARPSTQQSSGPELFFLFIATAAVLGAVVVGGIAVWIWMRARQAEDQAD